MASITVKALAGLATAGTLGGGVYGGIYAYNNATADTIENYLKNNNFTLIKESEADKWTKVLEAYKFEKNADSTLDANGIKTWCNSALKKTIKSKEETDYEKATKLCVNFENIKEKLGTNKTLEKTESKLTGKLAKFPEAIQKEIQAIKEPQDPDKVGKQIKTWCENNTKRRYLNDTEDYYKNILANCLTS